MAQTVDSAACSFPAELIEMVLKDIHILDLMMAASSMPPSWRAVIEGSKTIAKRIQRFTWDTNEDPPRAERPWPHRFPYRVTDVFADNEPRFIQGQSSDFTYNIPGTGTLYALRRQPRMQQPSTTTASEAFFLSPAIVPSTFRILDPATKNIKYTPGPRFGHGFVDLRDCEGVLAFNKGISTSERDVLFEYVVTYYGGDGCDKNGLLRDAKKVDKGVGTATKYVGVAGNGSTTGESGGLRRSGRIVKKTEKGESLATK